MYNGQVSKLIILYVHTILLLDNGATNTAQEPETVHHPVVPYDEVIKAKTPRMMDLISNPEKLAVDLWSAEFIGDQTKDDIMTTPTSDMKKSDKLLHEVYVYFKECDEKKKMEEFCEIMKKNCNPGIIKVLQDVLY